MNHTYRDSIIWDDHRRHRAEVKASYNRPEVVAIPGRELRPVAAAAHCHRQICRDAAEDLRGWLRIEPTPAITDARDVSRTAAPRFDLDGDRFDSVTPGAGLLVLLPFQPT